MKYLKVFALILVILFSAVALTACNRGTNLPSEGTVNVTEAAAQEDASVTENNSEASEESSVYYSTDADDLEILTVPESNTDKGASSNGSSASTEKDGSQNSTQNDSQETQASTSAEQGQQRIELPFVPAN